MTRRDTTSRIGAEDVEDLVRLLYANNLTEQSASGQVKDFVEQEAARHHVGGSGSRITICSSKFP